MHTHTHTHTHTHKYLKQINKSIENRNRVSVKTSDSLLF